MIARKSDRASQLFGRFAPISGKSASRGAEWLALKAQQFQASPPHPTALLLSCRPNFRPSQRPTLLKKRAKYGPAQEVQDSNRCIA